MVKLALLGLCLYFCASAVTAAASAAAAAEPPSPKDESGIVSSEDDEKTCSCSGPECQCCVDFNLTFVDLGGPGCVKMKYLSRDEGLLVNVSYGDRQLHNGHIKAQGPTTTCMDILLNLAQMCAKFTGIEMTDNGMKACGSLVPSFLGDSQDGFQLGCFVMGPQGMKLINSSFVESVLPTIAPEVSESDIPQNSTSVSEEDALVAAVNESAEEGIAWFSSFLGFNFGKSGNQTSSSAADS